MIKVSFIVVALNAESSLDTLFKCLNSQTYPHNRIEVILIDGNSQDATKEKMIEFKESDNDFERIVVLDNPLKTLPCGWNIALGVVKGDAIIRVDAHTSFPKEFIELNIRNLEKGENICGGKVISVPEKDDNWSVTLNEAENSMFGGGFAKFRHGTNAQYVNTIAFAIYRKEVFDKVGKYNELLTRTEDNEMHYRMKKAGYKFFYDPAIISYRKTRATLGKLLKQKYLNGYWIGRTMGVEPRCFSAYHFVPFVFVLAVITAIVFCFLSITWPILCISSLYGFANIVMTVSAVLGCKKRNKCFIFLPLLFFLLHFWYGIGTIVGLLQIWKNKERDNR